MTDRALAEDWFRRYRLAWQSNDVDDIRGLFTEDAVYRRWPGDPAPWVGHEGIVAGWLAHADEPDDHEFEWTILAVDGAVSIAQCVTTYYDTETVVYDNLFVIRLAGDGRAVEFTDWVIKRDPSEAG